MNYIQLKRLNKPYKKEYYKNLSKKRELVLNNETTGLMGPSNRRIINIEIE